VNDDGPYGSLGEGALGGFELQLEVEWVEASRSTSQLACCCLGQDSAGHQASIGCLGRVIAARDAGSAADLLGESADRVKEIHVVASEVVHTLQCGEGWRLQALVAHQAPNDSPVLLFDEAAVIFAIGTSAREGDVLLGAVVQERSVQEFAATVGVQPQEFEWQPLLQSARPARSGPVCRAVPHS
jgi:hypothetical protein